MSTEIIGYGARKLYEGGESLSFTRRKPRCSLGMHLGGTSDAEDGRAVRRDAQMVVSFGKRCLFRISVNDAAEESGSKSTPIARATYLLHHSWTIQSGPPK
jgi:hypothetical protein